MICDFGDYLAWLIDEAPHEDFDVVAAYAVASWPEVQSRIAMPNEAPREEALPAQVVN